mgnify:CR=1 FL=1
MLVYLLCVFVVGIPVMLGEFAVGRQTKMNAVGGYRSLAKNWRWLGYCGVIGAMFISGYYYIVAGWSLEYLFSSFGPLYRSGESFSAQWEAFQLSPRQAIYTVAFVLLTHIIIARGVEKGIEKASKVMMPALFIIFATSCTAFVASCPVTFAYFIADSEADSKASPFRPKRVLSSPTAEPISPKSPTTLLATSL